MTQEKELTEFTTKDMLRVLFGIAGATMASLSYKDPPTIINVFTVAGIIMALYSGYWLVRKYFFKD